MMMMMMIDPPLVGCVVRHVMSGPGCSVVNRGRFSFTLVGMTSDLTSSCTLVDDERRGLFPVHPSQARVPGFRARCQTKADGSPIRPHESRATNAMLTNCLSLLMLGGMAVSLLLARLSWTRVAMLQIDKGNVRRSLSARFSTLSCLNLLATEQSYITLKTCFPLISMKLIYSLGKSIYLPNLDCITQLDS